MPRRRQQRARRPSSHLLAPLVAAAALLLPLASGPAAATPLYVSHHWHLHQPIYWPYESVVQTEQGGAYSFSVATVHQDRSGPYADWPISAVQAGMDRGLPHIGAQVSLSGSLMENLDALEAEGWGFSGWQDRWQEGMGWQTSLGNDRLYLVSFGYFHPLMALISPQALEIQVGLHALAVERRFGRAPGRGMFPPESAFTPRMIPALLAAGVEWVLVDSIHLERAHLGYPWNSGSNLVPPNGADRLNSQPTDWVALQNLWAPSPVAAPWAYRPHWAVYVDPETGQESRIVVVPSARYEGNEDARGGFGAFLYDPVLSSYLDQNDDPAHPMLVVLAHDGDNYGAGVESYYMGNWSAYLDWLQAHSDTFAGTTIQDYLDQFPPDPDDTVHVEDGAWSGADNGDAEFSKWNGDPDADGYSPDRASWAVMTAAANHVQTAQALEPYTSLDGIVDGTGSATDLAWRWLLVGQTSCYWYWDRSEGGIWDSHPTRAANEAIGQAAQVLAAHPGVDPEPPSVYVPQRQPWNPGALEWSGTPEPTGFSVWTLAYDALGLAGVELHYRLDGDACRDVDNEVYDSGTVLTAPMAAEPVESRAEPSPLAIADMWTASIDAEPGTLVDYWVVATDLAGNVARSPIMHTAVGSLDGGGGDGGGGPWEPADPTPEDTVTIWSSEAGFLHWGVDGWTPPPEVYRPAGTADFGDGMAVETPLSDDDGDGTWTVAIGPFDDPSEPVSTIEFVFHHADGGWSSPDWTIVLGEGGDDDDSAPGECIPYFQGGEWTPGDDDDVQPDDDDAGDDDAGDDDSGGDDSGDDDDDDDAGDDDGEVRAPPAPAGTALPGCDCDSAGGGMPRGIAGLLLAACVLLARVRRVR